MSEKLRVAGLFAGIGGIERGLNQAGHESVLLCENDPGAQAVLRRRFEDVPLVGDIRELKSLPEVDLVAAGFPCQDLSQAGRTAGIAGSRSGLVDEVFRLLRNPSGGPRWLLLENVPFMLQLDRGRAMRHLTETLGELGYAWAYRVVDARAFGLPQRRLRVILLASRTHDPRDVLFTGSRDPRAPDDPSVHACGFYWTEGVRGLGWAVDAVPTLKGGSTIGIASPPAIRLTDRTIVTPGLRDTERLQGFPADWTEPAVSEAGSRRGHRWKLVGNAVSVPVAGWVGRQLANPGSYGQTEHRELGPGASWPTAAWGHGDVAFQADLSSWPERQRYRHLETFIKEPAPLSYRATAGFLNRAENGNLRFVDGFLDDVRAHLQVAV
jgi:DNA (cytosine-5)-methyltransferase 1